MITPNIFIERKIGNRIYSAYRQVSYIIGLMLCVAGHIIIFDMTILCTSTAGFIWLITSGVVGWFFVVILLVVMAFVLFKRYHCKKLIIIVSVLLIDTIVLYIAPSKPKNHDKCPDPADVTTIHGNTDQLHVMHPQPNVSYGQVRDEAITSMEYTTYESIDDSYYHYEN